MKRILVAAILLAASTASAQQFRILDNGSLAPQQFRLNLIGSTVSCVNNSSAQRTDCTWTGGMSSVVADAPLTGLGTSGSHLACPTCVTTARTVATTSPLGGGGALSGNLTLTCSTCINGSPSATGDLLYSTSGGAGVSALADVSAGSYLRSGGIGSAPLWSTLKVPNSATTGDVLYASSANTIGNLADVATGQVLKSGGVGTAPSYGTLDASIIATGTLPIARGGTNSGTALSGSSIMISDGTSVVQGAAGTTTTVLHGNASGNPTYSAVGLTTDVTGTLPVANGGTNSSTALSGSSIMVSNGTKVLQGDAGTSTTLLHGNTSGTPTYAAASLTADVTGTLPIANGGTNLTSAGGVANRALVTTDGSTWTATTVPNAALANSSVTVNTTSPLGGGGAVSLGASLTLTCSTCVTQAYATVQDEGSGLTQRSTLNFTGAGVSCADNSGSTRTDCTIAGSTGTVSSIATTSPISGGTITTTGTLSCPTCLSGTPTATGDIMYSTAGGQALSPLASVAAGSLLRSGGVASAPAWSTTTWPNSATTGDLLYASGSNAYANRAAVAAGSYLRSAGTSTAPVWSTLTLPNAMTVGDLLTASSSNTGDVIAAVATGQLLASAGTSTLPAWSNAPTIVNNTITTGQTFGLSLQNNTTATVGAQKYSPMLEFLGSGWKTTATAAGQTVKYALQARPIQASAAPNVYLDILESINGAAYSRYGSLVADPEGQGSTSGGVGVVGNNYNGSSTGNYLIVDNNKVGFGALGTGTTTYFNGSKFYPNGHDVDLGDSSTYWPNAYVRHLIGAGNKPTCAVGAGAGTGATCSTLTNSKDLSGTIEVVLGTTPGASGVVVTVTFVSAYGTAPFCTIWPGNAAAQGLLSTAPYVTSTTTTFVLNSGTVALTSGTIDYVYRCSQ